MRKIFCLILFLGLLSACGPSKNEYGKLLREKETLEKSNKELRDSLGLLRKEVEGYKYSPDKLLAAASERLKVGDRRGLNAVLGQLRTYHPTSNEREKVEAMLAKIDKDIADKALREKEQRMNAVTKLKKKIDDVQNITWYYNPYFVHYNNDNLTSIYIGKSDSNVWLRLKMSYNGDNWIFFENAYLSYEGNTRQIEFDPYKNKETENEAGEVWEWIDVPVNESILAFLQKMVESKSAKMQLRGKYVKTRKLSAKEISGIKDVLLAYDVLKNGE